MTGKREMVGGLAGFGFYLPEKEVPIRELAVRAGVHPMVVRFAGARTVREAPEGEYPSEMAIKAARKALSDADLSPERVDLIIYCGAGLPDYVIPQTAARVQHVLGARRAVAFDFVQGCSGMLSAFQTALAYLSLNGEMETVLLVSGDKWSQFTRHHVADSVFFGDGGGAVVVSRGTRDFRPLCFHILTDGTYYDLWRIEAGGIRHPISKEALDQGLHLYDCRNKAIAHGAFRDIYVPTMVRCVRGAIAKCGVHPQDIAYFDVVNANLKVLKMVADALGIPIKRTSAKYLIKYGHFGSHDVFFNLDMARREGRLNKGDLIVLQSTGVGFTWACAVIRY